MVDHLRELAEPSRRRILLELRSGPKSVSEIVAATGLKQPNVSNHLSRLRSRGIVRAQRLGRNVFYAISSGEVEALVHELAAQEAETETIPDESLEELAKLYAKRAVAGDEQACTQIIDGALRRNIPILRIYQNVLAVAMELIGKWYEVDAIDEGEEHLASAITERMMARALHYVTPLRRTAKRAILGCVEGNWHTIGLRMISDYLRLAGWKTLYLGASVPSDSILSATREHRPHMVLLSVTRSDTEAEALDLIRRLDAHRAESHPFLIGVGGQHVNANPEPFLRAGADFTAPNLAAFVEQVLPSLEERSGEWPALYTHRPEDEG